jgi:hypothetical protein
MTSFGNWRRLLAVSIIVVLTSTLAACATISTGSYSDKSTNFGDYESFSWIDDEPYIPPDASLAISALAKSMIESAIRRQLEQRGCSFTDDRVAADLLLAYTVGVREKTMIQSYPVGYRGHWGWHYPYSHYYFRNVSADNYTQGTLGVDVFDNETGKPVWHGWAEKTVTDSDRTDPAPTIEEGVAKLFASFPR